MKPWNIYIRYILSVSSKIKLVWSWKSFESKRLELFCPLLKIIYIEKYIKITKKLKKLHSFFKSILLIKCWPRKKKFRLPKNINNFELSWLKSKLIKKEQDLEVFFKNSTLLLIIK